MYSKFKLSMRSLLFCFFTLPLLTSAKQKLYLTGGYFYDFMHISNTKMYAQSSSLSNYTLTDAQNDGYFAGLGIKVPIAKLPVNLQLEMTYEHQDIYLEFDLERPTYNGPTWHGHNSQAIDLGYACVSPSVIYGHFGKGPFTFGYTAELGLAYKVWLTTKSSSGIATNNNGNYATAHIGFSLGYSAIQLRFAYEYGLTSMFKREGEWYGIPVTDFWRLSNNRINMGIAIYPIALIKGKI